jgi:polar amino acid transport system ATP-binding protein
VSASPEPELQIPGRAPGSARGSHLLGNRAFLVSTGSTIVFFLALALIFYFAPGSAEVRAQFFNLEDMKQAFVGVPSEGLPSVGKAFILNVEMFLVSEVLILIFALVIAVVRQIPGPVFFPFRLVATVYTDFFRGTPILLVIYLLGYGVPALDLPGISTQPDVVYAIAALVLSYSAYVSEVYRAGIESVHRSQHDAARSLGLSRWQTLRFVVLPQAVRRVIPAAAERLRQPAEGHGADLDARRDRGDPCVPDLRDVTLQLLALRDARLHVHPADDPVGPVHRPPDRARPPASGRGRRRMIPRTGEALRLEGVWKAFEDNIVLRGIDLSVDLHEVVCLIGASGSGKSTLLRCVNLLERVDAGRILVEGIDITAEGVDQDAIRQRIGIVFQAFNLFPHMTVLRNITLGPTEALKMPREEAEALADDLLTRFGLLEKRDEYPDRLSGGQQQRCAIVRALAMKPDIMLLDEITSALDPALVAEVLNVVRELAQAGMTMVIATHEMGFARDIASRVCFLEAGQILEQGPPEQIFTAPREEKTRQFLQRIIEAGRM